MIFDLQTKFQNNFSLFMTRPKPHNPEIDEPDFVSSLKETITENLNDPIAISFKENVERAFDSIEDVEYKSLMIIGLTKKILTQASSKKYQLNRH